MVYFCTADTATAITTCSSLRSVFCTLCGNIYIVPIAMARLGAFSRTVCAALVLSCVHSASGLYEKGDPVTLVTVRSFDKVEKSAVPVVVVSCFHCFGRARGSCSAVCSGARCDPGVPQALQCCCWLSTAGAAAAATAGSGAASSTPDFVPTSSSMLCRSSSHHGAATARRWCPHTRPPPKSCRLART